MFQNILDFILRNAWLVIILGGGLFNIAVRIAQKTNEQRIRRDALQEMSRQEQEALRTGRSVSPPPQPKAADPKAERRERIEALRQERMEQLRALREKRAGSPSGSGSGQAVPSSISQNHPNMPPIPVQNRPQRPQQQRPQPQRTQQPTRRPAKQVPQHRVQQVPHQQPAPAHPRRRQVVATTQPVESTRHRTVQPRPQGSSKAKVRKGGQIETLRMASNLKQRERSTPAPGTSARSMLRSRSSIRQAMILREILDTPISLRDQDIASGSLFS